jgi:CheY-like chemotaxis protein
MPERSGWEILGQLKALPATCAIPVIITSVIDEQSSGLLRSADGYLVKPITREQLRDALFGLAPKSASMPVAEASLAQTRILLAEDNEVNLDVIRDYLEAKGFAVLTARNGIEAITHAEQQRPDLILMDIQMPELDGISAIKQLRGGAKCVTTPIIALTALAMPGDRERCLAAGADAYLTKPVSLRELVASINQLLGG